MLTNEGLPQRRVLLLTPQLPYPPEQGTAIRNYNLLRQISRVHRTALLSFVHRDHPAGDIEALRACSEQVVTIPAPRRSKADRLRTLLLSRQPDMALRLWSEPFWRALQQLVEEWSPDVVQVEGIELGRYAQLLRKQSGPHPSIVFDDHNAEYLLQKRAALSDLRSPFKWPKAVYSLIQWRRLARLERDLCLQADAVLAVSEPDAQAIAQLDARISPLVIPNGVDTERYHPGLADALPLQHPAIVFTGKMDYRPNIDAVVWFVREVWPLLRQQHPTATLYLVGKAPSPAVQALAQSPGVMVTGYVPDILPYFGGADVYAVPLRVGGGTRLKVLEAMAAGLPIVSTSLGAEGIAITDQQELLLADDAPAFAAAVSALLRDREGALSLGSAARALVERRYDWAGVTPALVELLAGLG